MHIGLFWTFNKMVNYIKGELIWNKKRTPKEVKWKIWQDLFNRAFLWMVLVAVFYHHCFQHRGSNNIILFNSCNKFSIELTLIQYPLCLVIFPTSLHYYSSQRLLRYIFQGELEHCRKKYITIYSMDL
jgi:hypothetical protein